jgi:hypothetical protein
MSHMTRGAPTAPRTRTANDQPSDVDNTQVAEFGPFSWVQMLRKVDPLAYFRLPSATEAPGPERPIPAISSLASVRQPNDTIGLTRPVADDADQS